MSTTATLPAWHDPYCDDPVASQSWIKIKLAAADRALLLETQAEYAGLMQQLSKKNPTDTGKNKWVSLRAEYAKNRDPEILAELDRVGERGQILALEVRARNHMLHSEAAKIATRKNCGPVYARVFEAALGQVLEKIHECERVERQAAETVNLPYTPSPLLRSLAKLAGYLKTNATNYSNPADATGLPPPSTALGDLWQGIREPRKGDK